MPQGRMCMHNLACWEDHPMSNEVPLAPVIREGERSTSLGPNDDEPIHRPDAYDRLQEVGLTGCTDLKDAPT
eukprot:4070888-Prorocentrum_lima.AAC.1